MALTRSDKFIIAGAITLALAVVLGLAIWKKPQLFTGGSPAAVDAQKTAPMPEKAASEQPAPDIPEPPATTPAATPVQTAAPEVSSSVQAPEAQPGTEEAAAPEAAPAKEEDQILFKGDETLDKMFADMHKAEDAAPAGETPMPRDKPAKTVEEALANAPEAAANVAEDAAADEKPQAADEDQAAKPEETPELSPAFPPMEEKPETPAIKAEAMDEEKPAAKPAAKPASKPKTTATKKASKPARGAVLGVTFEDRPGEFALTVKTSAAVAGYEKFFLDNPPRVALDLSGVWRYTGPLSLTGKGKLVRMVRLGKHADRFRVVLDLAPDADLMLRGAPEITRIPGGLVLKLQK